MKSAPLPSMAYAGEILDALKSLDLEAIARESLEENAEVMADLNAEQLARGLRADGSEILPLYKPLTIEIKQTKSGLAAVTDHVTLFDTGSHYRELYAEVQGDEIEYGSRDEKSAKLQKKYSTSKGPIYGLTTDSKDELMNGPVAKSWRNKIESLTGLKFE